MNMAHRLLFLIVALLMTACASAGRDPAVLYPIYSQYKAESNKENIIELAEQYFTPSLLGKNYRTNPAARQQLLFKDYMASEDSHFEAVDSQTACLTINGYDVDKAPLIISLRYLAVDQRWLIDKIHVAFIEDRADFSKSARCPAR